jgi:hypothetical protein
MDNAMVHVMLPVQYLQSAGKSRLEPQVRLMVAVLQTVVDDLRGSAYRSAAGLPAPPQRQAYDQARAYVESTDRLWPFSFENVCEAIGLDPAGLRLQLGVADGPGRVDLEPKKNGFKKN